MYVEMDSFVFFEQEIYFAVHEKRPLSFGVEGCHNMNVGASLFILWAQNAGVSVFSCHNMNEMWRLFILCPIALWPVVKTQ